LRVQTLTVSVAELLGQPGKYRDISITQSLEDLRTALARLHDAPVSASLRAESVVEGILITGRARGHVAAQCARCLTDLGSEVEVEVCELFAAPGSEPVDEDAYRISGTEIDLEPMLRDALALALPLNPLCRRDCKGICAGCGADLNVAECVCSEDAPDPRWAALDALRARLENQGV
jgi:uncharacterized protein